MEDKSYLSLYSVPMLGWFLHNKLLENFNTMALPGAECQSFQANTASVAMKETIIWMKVIHHYRYDSQHKYCFCRLNIGCHPIKVRSIKDNKQWNNAYPNNQGTFHESSASRSATHFQPKISIIIWYIIRDFFHLTSQSLKQFSQNYYCFECFALNMKILRIKAMTKSTYIQSSIRNKWRQ